MIKSEVLEREKRKKNIIEYIIIFLMFLAFIVHITD
jgi:hypothetical protein